MTDTAGVTSAIKLAILIDDEKIDQMIYQRVMARSGLVETSLSFSRAQDALDFLAKEDRPKVDLIFLDINMPSMNGFEFLEEATTQFGEDFAKLVVVMLTTSLNPSDYDRATAHPAVRKFLHKPLTQDQLHDVVDIVRAEPMLPDPLVGQA